MLGVQNGEHLRLTGKLWGWSSQQKQIFKKTFDSKTSFAASSQITHFYNRDIRNGSVLCIYRDLKSNRVHFDINGEEGWVSFSRSEPDFWYGYIRLSSTGSGSKIQVTLVPEEDLAYFDPRLPIAITPVQQEPTDVEDTGNSALGCLPVERIAQAMHAALCRVVPDPEAILLCQGPAETPWLSHHYVMHTSRPRGLCLLINNVRNLAVGEEQLKGLFKFLSFDVLIERDLQRDEIYNLAKEFAKKDHTYFDTFVVIFLSFSGRCSEISCPDGRNASLEHVMVEFTASRCPSLRGKPKLFFVQRVKGIPSRVDNECSIFASGSFAEKDAVRLPCISASEKDSCPEEADFLLICVTSTYPADQPNREPGSLFIQILDQVIRSSTVPLAPITPALAQEVSYEMNKDPRGLCVIVNNVNFQNRDLNRPGAVEDERSLQLLFRTLFFEVIIRRDLTSHELEKVAQKFGAANHKAYNAFVFIVMSHGGDRDCILGVDGRETTVKNLMCEFRENKCPSLKHKPKAFIIQTCRGCRDNADNSISSPVNDINLQQKVVTTSQGQISSQPCDTAFVTDCTLPRSVFPPEADFVLAFATAPGYVSYRDPDNGTWFIQALVEVISKYHHHHHFLEILTEVTRLVVERVNSVQVPAPMDTLTKFLYL
ncbi:uncharacterized protein LOC113669936 [Pocillopora damicornis]|uniref:uncharacterized protein LOC113669936 n=1 Tax=Pocillopora damicornis TaxID=46731 RepID=UPI000F557E18|nr:uncharacterized protein LOC113669936 [Pocillopora damicornis]